MLLEESLPGSSLDVIHGVVGGPAVGGPAVGGVIKLGLSGDTSLRSSCFLGSLDSYSQALGVMSCDYLSLAHAVLIGSHLYNYLSLILYAYISPCFNIYSALAPTTLVIKV